MSPKISSDFSTKQWICEVVDAWKYHFDVQVCNNILDNLWVVAPALFFNRIRPELERLLRVLLWSVLLLGLFFLGLETLLDLYMPISGLRCNYSYFSDLVSFIWWMKSTQSRERKKKHVFVMTFLLLLIIFYYILTTEKYFKFVRQTTFKFLY